MKRQEEIFNEIHNRPAYGGFHADEFIQGAEQHCHLDLDQRNWLKNIKERALWRPSEEQLKALECVIQEESTNSELIKKLYNELSKL